MTTARANCWSITINNPTEKDLNPILPAGWRMTGQLEKGEEEGTEHYQAMLTTPQVRFAAVKKVLPRAHIEPAKNKAALQKYVSKEETRLALVPDVNSSHTTIYEYQSIVASLWDDTEWDIRQNAYFDSLPSKRVLGDVALDYVDDLIYEDIRNGRVGAEYVAVNPMWRSAWKRFWKAILVRSRLQPQLAIQEIEEDAENIIIPPQTEDRQTDNN